MTENATSLLRHLASMPAYGHGTLTTKDLRELLLETGGQLLAQGHLYNIVGKPLGAGVYRVSLKPTTKEPTP